MKQFVRLLLYNYFSKSGQKPACQIAVKTFLSVPFNVTGSPALYSTCRKLSSYKIINSSTADEGKKLNQQSGEGNSRNENSVIYYGTLTSQIKGVKVFTCTSSIGGLIIQPMLIQNVITGENVSLSLAMGTVVGFFTFVTPFLIHSLTKKYVTEIRYNSKTDTYTATTLSFFLRRIDIEFKIEDIEIPERLPVFTTMCVKGKPVLVVRDSFLVVSHYIRMMGYDKPIDLKLSTPIDDMEKNNVAKRGDESSHE